MKSLLCALVLLVGLSAFGQASIKRNYFTTNQDPEISFTNGTLVSTNIYVSNLFATNITVNNITNFNTFNGRTVITTNLFVTNGFITYLTNNTFYTTNVTEQFVTNNLSYITNLYGPFITNNNLYSTNIYTTNLFATYVTNNTDYITNLYGPFITNDTIYTTNIFNSTAYVTNLYGPFITNFQLYSTDIFVTNLTANYITNVQAITTNLFVSNAFFTNLTVEFITNDFSFITNLYTSNAFITNVTANYITNNTLITTNAFISNAFITNITIFEAQWGTNKWVGPTNDIDFSFGTYQKFKASTDMEVTGLKGVNPTNENTTVLLLDPGGATRTLYFPNNWTNYTLDKGNAYTIGSTNIAIVTLSQYGQENTNVLVRIWGVIPPATPAQLWTNSDGVITQVGSTNVAIGALTANNPNANLDAYNAPRGGSTAHDSIFIGSSSTDLIFGGGGMVAVEGDQFAGDPGTNGVVAGESSAVVGDTGGWMALQYGVIGISTPFTSVGGTNVGVAGIATAFGSSGTFVGGYFAEAVDNTTKPHYINSALIADSLATGDPTQLWRTNGDTTVASMNASGVLTAHGVVDNAFAANGVVTNDSTGLLHTTPTLPSTLLPTDLAYTDKNNAFTTASSNYVAMTVTTSTNQNQVTPDFSIPEQLMTTNAAFTFLAPVGVDTTLKTVQWTLVNVTNTTAAAVAITSPANCHTVGTAYVTNLTCVWFQCYAQKFTNAFYIPVF